VWTEQETIEMLELYAEKLKNVGPMKQFRTKMEMWNNIANTLSRIHGNQKTGQQVADKYKNTLAVKKKVVDTKNLSGSGGGLKIPYEIEIDRINAMDDTIEPEVMIGVSPTILKKNNAQPTSSKKKPTTTRRNQNEEFSSPYLDRVERIMGKLEEGKNRRHAERLAFCSKFFGPNNNENE
jgi:hypothetical protein